MGYIAGMAASAKVRFTVGVIITADEPDSLFSICYDTVICVSSEVEAEQAVKTLIESCSQKSISCLDFMDIMWVIHCGRNCQIYAGCTGHPETDVIYYIVTFFRFDYITEDY